MNKLALAVATCCAVGVSAPSQAEVRFNGFASIVAGQTMDSGTSLFGYDDDIAFKPESLFALQATADVSDGLTATAQIVAKGENDFDAEFEWAYLTYQVSDSTQVSAGKMRIPFYRYSDFLDVGYAYNWVRPPTSVYSLVFSTYEGLNLVHNSTLGDWDSTLQVIYGNFEGDINAFSNADPSEVKDLAGINWTVSYDWFTARAAYLIGDLQIDDSASPEFNWAVNGANLPGPVWDALGVPPQAFGLDAYPAGFAFGLPGLETILPGEGTNLLIDEDSSTFWGLGFSIDYNDFLVDAEITEISIDDSVLATQEQFYVTVGYRLGDWVVHATYEEREDTSDVARYNARLLSPEVLAATGGLSEVTAGLVQGSLASQLTDRSVRSVGARYNFHYAAALKFDFTTRKDNLSNRDVDVISVGVDLVF